MLQNAFFWATASAFFAKFGIDTWHWKVAHTDYTWPNESAKHPRRTPVLIERVESPKAVSSLC